MVLTRYEVRERQDIVCRGEYGPTQDATSLSRTTIAIHSAASLLRFFLGTSDFASTGARNFPV